MECNAMQWNAMECNGMHCNPILFHSKWTQMSNAMWNCFRSMAVWLIHSNLFNSEQQCNAMQCNPILFHSMIVSLDWSTPPSIWAWIICILLQVKAKKEAAAHTLGESLKSGSIYIYTIFESWEEVVWLCSI
jgi:hypothetical protein